MRTVLVNCGPIVSLSGEIPITGSQMTSEDLILSAGKAIIVNSNKIERIVESEVAIEEFGEPTTLLSRNNSNTTKVIDLEGRAVIPGLVDSHAHIVWSGDRSREVRWRQMGHTYSEIANFGGGIISTVESTKNSSELDLFKIGRSRLKVALRNGTTHVETKSGYGLDSDSELKLLKVAHLLSQDESTPTIDSTWLGAHAIPKGYTLSTYTEELISEQLPLVVESGLARSADVFCEPGWFGLEESEDILRASKNQGLELRMHIDEFADGGGGDLAAELKVSTADHAHYTNEDARLKLRDAGVNTGFLPGTPFSMGSDWPNFDLLTEMGAPWSIATDYNPNNQVLSIPFLASCLVQRCGVDPLIALVASTVNPAATTPHPSGLKHGCILPGSVANLNILNSPHWESWCLTPGTTPFAATMLEGKLISHDL